MADLGLVPLEPQLPLSDRVYLALLDSIVTQALKGGQHLVIEDLAAKTGTSVTPVREALSRLQQEGLVTKVAYQGWRVRTFTVHEITEIYQVRAALESLAVRLCCTNCSSALQKELLALQSVGERALAQGDLHRYRQYNDSLHGLIFAGAGNETLKAMMQSLANRVRLFSQATVYFPGRPQRAMGEHAAIVDAIRTGDARKGGVLMEQHILEALRDLLDSRARDPQ